MALPSNNYRALVAPGIPALPIAPGGYDRQYQDGLNNILRQYFTVTNGILGAVLANTGGKNLRFPYGAAQSLVDQTVAANTPTLIEHEDALFLNGMTHDAADGLHVEQSGIYNLQFSTQLANLANTIEDATIWVEVNGTAVADTASVYSLHTRKSAGVASHLIAVANFFVQLTEGDYVELWWQATSADVSIETFAAAAPVPAVPSSVMTLSFVSALPTAP